jgi:hypothetical protein
MVLLKDGGFADSELFSTLFAKNKPVGSGG